MTDVGPEHDRFHPPGDDDPAWSETSWTSFCVPERRIAGTLYPLFRPNLGVCSLAVSVWDDTAHAPWQILYNRALWHLPMPGDDLTRCEVGDAGNGPQCISARAGYRVQC